MSVDSTIYIIASDAAAGQVKVAELLTHVKNGSLVASSDTTVIAIFKDADMRGRTVTVHDTVVICGDWSGRRAHEVQQLVEMFNTRRNDSRAPRLSYRAGEAPEVDFPVLSGPQIFTGPQDPTGPQGATGPQSATGPVAPGDIWYDTSSETIQTFNGNSYTIATGPNGPPGPSVTTSAQVAWDQVLPAHEQRVVQDAQDAAKRERAISADMREQVKKVKAEIKQLREWLSGVQPVEDAEIPGIFWCAVCSKRLPDHLPDCPAG